MKSCIKYHGGKYYIASKIVALMPKYNTYVEPYFGSGAVLFANPNYLGTSEIINDIDHILINFWTVLKSDFSFAKFKRLIEATPVSEELFKYELDKKRVYLQNPDVLLATNFFIINRQSLAARGESFTPISKSRRRRDMNEQCSAWLTAIEGLDKVHNRIKRAVILNRDATQVIKEFDAKDTFFYLDPLTFLKQEQQKMFMNTK